MVDLKEATCSNIAEMANRKLVVLDRKIKEIEEIKATIIGGLKKYEHSICSTSSSQDNCPVQLL